jgi:hypothetical protein
LSSDQGWFDSGAGDWFFTEEGFMDGDKEKLRAVPDLEANGPAGEAPQGEPIQCKDNRGTKPEPKAEPELTPEQKEQQKRENRIIDARQAGTTVLLSNLRRGRTPSAYVVIDAIVELASRADQADRLFERAGQSFVEIQDIIAATLGYLAACEARRKLRFWRRWFAPHPVFPTFGNAVQVETEKPPVIPQEKVEASLATARTVH